VAGSDCGFASNPRDVPEIHPTIVWAKLRALVRGARLATERVRAGGRSR
jgi:5-methyltetrahydropteroyltriglutamate--homocysteine methyltransferase